MTEEGMARFGLALLFKDAGAPVGLAARLAFDGEVFAAVTGCERTREPVSADGQARKG